MDQDRWSNVLKSPCVSVWNKDQAKPFRGICVFLYNLVLANDCRIQHGGGPPIVHAVIVTGKLSETEPL